MRLSSAGPWQDHLEYCPAAQCDYGPLGELQLWAEEAMCRDEKTASKVESQLGGVNVGVGERLLQRSVGNKRLGRSDMLAAQRSRRLDHFFTPFCSKTRKLFLWFLFPITAFYFLFNLL